MNMESGWNFPPPSLYFDNPVIQFTGVKLSLELEIIIKILQYSRIL